MAGCRAFRYSCLAFGSSANTSRVASCGHSRLLVVTAKCYGKLPLQSLPDGCERLVLCTQGKTRANLSGKKIQNITGSTSAPCFVHFGITTFFTRYGYKPSVLNIEKPGKARSCCSYFIFLIFPTAAFNTAKMFFHWFLF